MRPELEKYYQIDLYINGELKGESLAAFESQLQIDPDFAEEVAHQKQVNFVVEGAAFAGLREQMSRDILNLDLAKARKRNQYKIAGVIVVFLLSTLILFYGNKKEEQALIKNPTTIQPSVAPIVHGRPESLISTKNSTPAIVLKKSQSLEKPFEKPKASFSTVDASFEKAEPIVPEIKNLEEIPLKVLPVIETEIRKANASANKDSLLLLTEHLACAGFKPKIESKIEASCKDKSNGKVTFNLNSVKGGKSPYSIHAAGPTANIKAEKFLYLESGEHVFVLTDSKGCSENLHIYVPEEVCLDNKYVLNTSIGENWLIPVTSHDFQFSVHDRSGRVVYKHSSIEISQNQWNGTDINGSFLETGLYIYVIEYPDGKKQSGQISIVK